jgi:diadenosine tetraphosphate (Ap4A) HIT family hydrolase
VIALWDGFPVSPGHLLIIPRRHVATWWEATAAERSALTDGLERGRAIISSRHQPDGYNVGINVGRAAGQTVFHLHVHLMGGKKLPERMG